MFKGVNYLQYQQTFDQSLECKNWFKIFEWPTFILTRKLLKVNCSGILHNSFQSMFLSNTLLSQKKNGIINRLYKRTFLDVIHLQYFCVIINFFFLMPYSLESISYAGSHHIHHCTDNFLQPILDGFRQSSKCPQSLL